MVSQLSANKLPQRRAMAQRGRAGAAAEQGPKTGKQKSADYRNHAQEAMREQAEFLQKMLFLVPDQELAELCKGGTSEWKRTIMATNVMRKLVELLQAKDRIIKELQAKLNNQPPARGHGAVVPLPEDFVFSPPDIPLSPLPETLGYQQEAPAPGEYSFQQGSLDLAAQGGSANGFNVGKTPTEGYLSENTMKKAKVESYMTFTEAGDVEYELSSSHANLQAGEYLTGVKDSSPPDVGSGLQEAYVYSEYMDPVAASIEVTGQQVLTSENNEEETAKVDLAVWSPDEFPQEVDVNVPLFEDPMDFSPTLNSLEENFDLTQAVFGEMYFSCEGQTALGMWQMNSMNLE